MEAVNLADRVTSAVVVVVGVAIALQGFVYAAVTILRGMIGGHPQRRIILPVVGITAGWTFTAAAVALMEVGWSTRVAALIFLAGFWEYAIAAGLNAQGKEARK